MRPVSKISPEWWDYTTLSEDILEEAASLEPEDLMRLSRDGFTVTMYETLEEFYLAEALEYIEAWRQSTPQSPAGICGPIGPTEHLPLVAMLVNKLELDLTHAHFWAMDEWVENGEPVGIDHPMSFKRANLELCFRRIRPDLALPEGNMHFPVGDLEEYSRSYDEFRCVIMQGGQGEAKHWAFNDPPRREGKHKDEPPPVEEYAGLGTRVLEIHPLTVMQNARTSGAGNAALVPRMAVTCGPVETFKAERVSIWHAGVHDNPFGMRLTTLMVSRKVIDTSVPISLLALHPDVRFNFYRSALSSTAVSMH